MSRKRKAAGEETGSTVAVVETNPSGSKRIRLEPPLAAAVATASVQPQQASTTDAVCVSTHSPSSASSASSSSSSSSSSTASGAAGKQSRSVETKDGATAANDKGWINMTKPQSRQLLMQFWKDMCTTALDACDRNTPMAEDLWIDPLGVVGRHLDKMAASSEFSAEKKRCFKQT